MSEKTLTEIPKKKVSAKEAKRELWLRGDLRYLLHAGQIKFDEVYTSDGKKVVVILSSRRLGKTFYVITKAIELCLKKKNALIKYICPQQKQGKNTIRNIMRTLLKDCPADLKPEFKTADLEYVFPNGSVIQIAGTDNGNHENLRGGDADLCIVDEAGFCSDLGYVVRSILIPTTLTTKGRVILLSTPSKDPTHEFMVDYVKPAQAEGRLRKFTIYDNPLITSKDIDEILAEYPSRENHPDFKREYLCEITTTSEDTIIPEADVKNISKYVGDWHKPPFYDYYVSGDVGFRDLTGYLFGYYDFKKAMLIIEDELVLHEEQVTTENIANGIKEKEKLYYTREDGSTQAPFIRVMDNDLIMINDLNKLHNLSFVPTKKDNKEAAVNEVRMYFAQNRIKIHPRCKHLIYHLQYGTWDRKKNQFHRIPDIIDSSGQLIRGAHVDLLDSLIYMIRNLIPQNNPYPAGYDRLSGSGVFSSAQRAVSEFSDNIKQMLNMKRR